MPAALLEALDRLAKLKGYRSPAAILADVTELHKPSKPILYWIRMDADD